MKTPTSRGATWRRVFRPNAYVPSDAYRVMLVVEVVLLVGLWLLLPSIIPSPARVYGALMELIRDQGLIGELWTSLTLNLEAIAQHTERFTGADLEDLVRRAGLTALRRGLDTIKVTKSDFEVALTESRASVTQEMLEEYERIQDTLKSDATAPLGGIGFVLPGMLRPKTGGKP